MTITEELLPTLKAGDFVWLPSQFMKFVVDRVDLHPPADWRNTQGLSRVVAHRLVLPRRLGDEADKVGVERHLDPKMLTLGTPHYNAELSELENEILDSIHFSGQRDTQGRYHNDSTTKAVLVWRTRDDLEMGPCRWAYDGPAGETFSVSPFPGGWTQIERSSVVRVRHIATLVR